MQSSGNGENDKWVLSRIIKDGALVGTLLVDDEANPDARMPWLVYMTFPYKNRPLPSSTEFDEFDRVDKVIQELCKKHHAKNVAVYMRDGIRDWIVYAAEGPAFLKVAESVFPKSKAKIHVQPDHRWKQYMDFREAVKRSQGRPGPLGNVPR
jgi:hypothetical protein